jgi:prophage maintenance system killer protein
MALGVFLEDNGLTLAASDDDATDAMMAVAKGEQDIEGLTGWLRTRVRAL